MRFVIAPALTCIPLIHLAEASPPFVHQTQDKQYIVQIAEKSPQRWAQLSRAQCQARWDAGYKKCMKSRMDVGRKLYNEKEKKLDWDSYWALQAVREGETYKKIEMWDAVKNGCASF